MRGEKQNLKELDNNQLISKMSNLQIHVLYWQITKSVEFRNITTSTLLSSVISLTASVIPVIPV